MGTRAESPGRRYPIEFGATAGEYFRIWIVNLALTIVTLGIYSAWAKVRKRRYFYGHTRIGGDAFEYRGNPIAILKGRLIALVALVIFYGGSTVSPWLQYPLVIATVFVMPWLRVRSLAFNAYNTAFRNIRLHFDGTYAACLKIFLTWGWLALIPLLYPYFKRRLVQFVAEHHAYGTTRFGVADFKKPFIHAYGVAYGVGALGLIGFFTLFLTAAGRLLPGRAGVGARVPLMMFVALATFGLGFFLVSAFLRARTTNAIWNSVSVGPVRFESTLRARDLTGLYAVHAVAIVLTLGLAAPWAVVRTMRYRTSMTTVIADGPLDAFVQAESEQVGAAGEEVVEMFDFDVGF